MKKSDIAKTDAANKPRMVVETEKINYRNQSRLKTFILSHKDKKHLEYYAQIT